MILSKCCKSDVYVVETSCHNYFVCCKCGRPSDTMTTLLLATEGVHDAGYESKVATSTHYS